MPKSQITREKSLKKERSDGRVHTIGADGVLKSLALREVGRRTTLQAGAKGILNRGVGAEAIDISTVKR